ERSEGGSGRVACGVEVGGAEVVADASEEALGGLVGLGSGLGRDPESAHVLWQHAVDLLDQRVGEAAAEMGEDGAGDVRRGGGDAPFEPVGEEVPEGARALFEMRACDGVVAAP